MEIIEWLCVLALAFTIAYAIHMAHKYEESRLQLERASVRMRQLEEEIYESNQNNGRVSLEIVDDDYR